MAANLIEVRTDTGIVRWANGRDEADEIARDLLYDPDVLTVTCEPLAATEALRAAA